MIILVGIPGCGKSSILKEVQRHVSPLQVINYGDKMLEEAALEEISRDQLRKMSTEEQKKISLKAAKKIVKESKGIPTILDTHALVRTKLGFIPGLPKEIIEILSPRACAIIECSPALIVQRRSKDIKRKRDEESEEELALHQDLSRSALLMCCSLVSALFCRISNDSPSIEENARPLVKVVQSFL